MSQVRNSEKWSSFETIRLLRSMTKTHRISWKALSLNLPFRTPQQLKDKIGNLRAGLRRLNGSDTRMQYLKNKLSDEVDESELKHFLHLLGFEAVTDAAVNASISFESALSPCSAISEFKFPLSVMSWNHGGGQLPVSLREELTRETINILEPDLICLQECRTKGTGRVGRMVAGGKLYDTLRPVCDLNDKGDLRIFYNPEKLNINFIDQKIINNIKSKISEVEYGVRRSHDTYLSRCMILICQVFMSNSFVLVNYHAPKCPEFTQNSRLIKFLVHISDALQLPALLVGDFNAVVNKDILHCSANVSIPDYNKGPLSRRRNAHIDWFVAIGDKIELQYLHAPTLPHLINHKKGFDHDPLLGTITID